MILLIKPEPAHNAFSLDMALKTEPLELEYIKAMLTAASIPSYLYEAAADKRSFSQILEEYRPDAVCITGYITQEYLMLSYAKEARAFNSRMVTILGGSHAQLNFHHFYKPEVSYICRSDNIYSILDVLSYEGIVSACHDISRKTALPCGSFHVSAQDPIHGLSDPSSHKALHEIDGLCYRDDGVWKSNPIMPFDINRLPIPDRSHFLEHKDSYRYLDVSPVALLKTSSSCPFQCSFCYGRTLNGGVYEQRDLDLVMEELKTIPCDNIQIVDDDFLYDVPRLMRFIALLREHDIHKNFICYGRSDFISTHESLMKELAGVGLRYCMVGLEAVDDTYLDDYHKLSSKDSNLETIRILDRLDIRLVGLFIVDIRFTRKDFRNMRRFIHQQKITYTGVSIFTPIPGTGLYEEYKNQLITSNMEYWDFMHLVLPPANMSRFHFYLEYYLFVMDLFRIAQKAGIYRFLRLKDYKNIFLKLLFTDSFRKRT